ncbi:unnamed protein product [Hermetia illucens]|uniref:protein disulfide-isomerase n=1 Tax=Hermetia illucens TaxID=343691 RepID=A0A7R8UIE0_HERIL|nr:unnamed protein product [Hermetia illucens]
MDCEITPKTFNIKSLDQSNFYDTIKSTKFILVLFFTENCTICLSTDPEYADVARRLTEQLPEVKLGRMQCEGNEKITEELRITEYPTLIFFREGFPIYFPGEVRINKILEWVENNIRPSVKTITTIQDAKEFISKKKLSVLGFFQCLRSVEAAVLATISCCCPRVAFAQTSDKTIFEKYQVKENCVILFKRVDEYQATFAGPFNEKDLLSFVRTYSTPLISEIKRGDTTKPLIQASSLHLLLLVSTASGHLTEYVEPLCEVAKEFRNKVLFVIVDPGEEGNERLYERLGVELYDTPQFRLIDWDAGPFGTPYKPVTREITPDHVRNFLNSYFQGNLKRYYASQPILPDWCSGDVIELVGENFEEIVFNKSEDVVVMFYDPYCTLCHFFEDDYAQVGFHYQDRKEVLVTRINIRGNELEHVKVTRYPVIKLYKKETNEEVELGDYQCYDNILTFLETGGKIGKFKPEREIEDAKKRCHVHYH